MMLRSLLIVVSAPSGAGKTTLCDRLLAERSNIRYSVSCTTRAPRGAEQDGRDYYFLSDDEFLQRVERGEFLEYAEVHGYRYGTLRKMVVDSIAEGMSILMDIDVQGAGQLRAKMTEDPVVADLKKAFVDIFIAPPSIEVLADRLEKRGEDAPEIIERSVRNAAREMERSGEFMHLIVNKDLDNAYKEFKDVLDLELGSV